MSKRQEELRERIYKVVLNETQSVPKAIGERQKAYRKSNRILKACKDAGMMTGEEIFDMLLSHKEYQRKWKGQLQILFGFSPDELDKLKGLA